MRVASRLGRGQKPRPFAFEHFDLPPFGEFSLSRKRARSFCRLSRYGRIFPSAFALPAKSTGVLRSFGSFPVRSVGFRARIFRSALALS